MTGDGSESRQVRVWGLGFGDTLAGAKDLLQPGNLRPPRPWEDAYLKRLIMFRADATIVVGNIWGQLDIILS
jgi:hypothetical protein